MTWSRVSFSVVVEEKSTPLQMGVSAGMEELSPNTAEAETEGMCGLALTALFCSSGFSLRMDSGVAAAAFWLLPKDASGSSVDSSGVSDAMVSEICRVVCQSLDPVVC